ncbi:MAG: ECF-type sigma factor [Acidobacteriota bacterium]|nr:ECF-type sigma factor [Acidobacteriota bacterium]
MTPVPFVIGQWVRGRKFYGREVLINEILQGPRNAIWVLGTRRIGKTSLLKQLEYLTWGESERRYFPLFWDLQGADDPDELHAGFSEALLDTEERLEEVDLDASALVAEDLFDSIRRLRRSLKPRKLRLLLLCDEVEELVKLNREDPALLRKLRHAFQASEDVRAVLASTMRLWTLSDQREDTSPFLHGFTPPVFISRLADTEARDLLVQSKLPRSERPAFSDREMEEVQRRCDSHPYLLQLVGKRLLETGDLEEAVELVAADSMVSYFFSVDFEMLQPVERDVLRTVARHTAAASDTIGETLGVDATHLRQAVQNLDNLGFVRRDRNGRVELANDFFRRWLTDLAPRSLRPTATALQQSPGDSTLPRPSRDSVIDGRYELRRQVGEGATGIVYEAYDQLLRSRIALKLLRPEYAGNRTVLERFRKEILLSRNLGHPNILRVYHLGQLRDQAYLTMQWVEGPTLARTIADEGALPEKRVTFVGARLASALSAAHVHSVLHRDIKPHNIMIDTNGEPLIMDFGLARLLEDPSHTTTGVFLGTPNYVSPEQASLQPLDERSDIYSLGVVLFEMASGRCPFEGDTVSAVLEMHRNQRPIDPRELVPDLSPELSELVLRCLEKRPEKRFGSASELHAKLVKFLPGGAAPTHSGAVVSQLGVAETDGGNAAEDLLPLVYDELRRLARGFLSRERPGHTLQPTALVHEAYLRLANQSRVAWQGRSHFLAVGAKVMRRLLIDHARGRGRIKRGGDQQRITFNEVVTPSERDLGLDELLALDTALQELAVNNARQAEIVELRFFAGMTVAEVAEYLGVSKRTVEGDWAEARDWLRQRLSAEPESAE